MPSEKISQLPAAGTLTGSEELPAVQSGSTVEATAAAVAEIIAPITASDAIQYVSTNSRANDSNDGRTAGTAKASIAAAIAALPTDGNGTRYGTVYVGAGSYTVSSTINVSERTSIIGAGSLQTIITHTGNNDCFRVKMAAFNTTKPQAGVLSGFEIVGNSGASAVAIHMGDIVGLTIEDVYIRDYTSGTGLWQDNQSATNAGSCERTVLSRVAFKNNGKAIRQTVNGGGTSFDYQRWNDLRFELNATGQIGISTEGTAQMLRCSVTLTCNVNASGSTTTVWSVTSGATVDQCSIRFDAEQSSGSGATALHVDATPSTFKYFADSHINLAGLIWLIESGATYGLATDATDGLQTHTYTSGTLTINADIAKTHSVTVTANMAAALVIAHPALGQDLRIAMIQDGTGGRKVLWPTNIVWANGLAPVCYAASEHVTVDLYYDGTNWNETSRSVSGGVTTGVFGMAYTFVPAAGSAAGSVGANNRAYYMRAIGSARQVNALQIAVGVQSGNVCVGVYATSGNGTSATPSALKATSGSTACPAPGVNSVSLSSTIDIEEGDWLAIACDNTTATFVHGQSVIAAGGWNKYQESAFPLPSTATSAGNPGYPIWLQSA